jgi:ribonuclease HI
MERYFSPIRGELVWYTDSSRTNESTGAWVYRAKPCFSLGKYTTVFQREMYAIKAYTVENLDRGCRNRNVCVQCDSQAMIKALDRYQINSKLLWGCCQSLMKLAEHNRVQVIWVLGHRGNGIADQLARLGYECLLIGPEPACGISAGIVKKAVRDRTEITEKLGNC